MNKQSYFDGTVSEPKNNYDALPVIDHSAMTDPKDYKAGKDLAAAVNVALTLGMPLLLTGEPGCGKSELARRIAWELGFPANSTSDTRQVLKYAVKSTTEAKDLFYTFDAVGRFHAVQTWKAMAAEGSEVDGSGRDIEHSQVGGGHKNVAANKFIEYQAMGLAILRAKGKNGDIPAGSVSENEFKMLPETGHRSVVLIDEIDKAPRDVPNDILNEIEHTEFTIPELGGVRIGLDSGDQDCKPVVIITSNSERDLPSAFLRRCVYYHVPFPAFQADAAEGDDISGAVTVENIVVSRLGKRFANLAVVQRDALALSRYLRSDSAGLLKPPSLAEILNWLNYIADFCNNQALGDDRLFSFPEASIVLAIKTTLLKTRDDQARAEQLYENWIALAGK